MARSVPDSEDEQEEKKPRRERAPVMKKTLAFDATHLQEYRGKRLPLTRLTFQVNGEAARTYVPISTYRDGLMVRPSVHVSSILDDRDATVKGVPDEFKNAIPFPTWNNIRLEVRIVQAKRFDLNRRIVGLDVNMRLDASDEVAARLRALCEGNDAWAVDLQDEAAWSLAEVQDLPDGTDLASGLCSGLCVHAPLLTQKLLRRVVATEEENQALKRKLQTADADNQALKRRVDTVEADNLKLWDEIKLVRSLQARLEARLP